MDVARPTARTLVGILLAAAAAGCAAPQGTTHPADLDITASWRDAQHLDVTVRNIDSEPMTLGADTVVEVSGPDGSVPVDWSGMEPLDRGEIRNFELHVMEGSDGTLVMMLDHEDAARHAPLPEGDYTVRVGDAAASAALAESTEDARAPST